MRKILLTLSAMLALVACANYSFTLNDKTYNYQEDTLKFYENSILLDKDEISKMFPDYEIILISDFDKEKKYYLKNSMFNSKKVLLLNDTTRTFYNFFIYPISARNDFQEFKNGEIKSLITIYGNKNVRLKHEGGDEFEIVVKTFGGVK